MSDESSKFYTRCINEVMLNEYAVKSGKFDMYICHMIEPNDFSRWRHIVPEIAEIMKRVLATRQN